MKDCSAALAVGEWISGDRKAVSTETGFEALAVIFEQNGVRLV